MPQEDRDAFARSRDAANADWELHVFGGVGHSFTNPDVHAYAIPGFGYHDRVARRSWAMALDVLGESFAENGAAGED